MASQHIVTCRYCKKKFDANKEEYVQPTSRQYYHLVCFKKIPQEKQQKVVEEDIFFKTLSKYIPDYNYIQSKKLADKYIKDYGFSWMGMAFTLEYYYGICKNSTKGAKDTIGIIPYVYEQAKKYNDRAKHYIDNPVPSPIAYQENEKTYVIEAPTSYRPIKLFFEGEDD